MGRAGEADCLGCRATGAGLCLGCAGYLYATAAGAGGASGGGRAAGGGGGLPRPLALALSGGFVALGLARALL